MDRFEALVAGAQFDVCSYNGIRSAMGSPLRFIHHVAVPGRGTVSLFKVLLTSVCTNDCAYCANRTARDRPRATYRPEELARVFMELNRKRLARGLFLSSGIAGNASRTMESMITTVEILRRKYEFQGYIHLKILPGASFDCVEEACKLADRVSVNMEAPTAQHLARLSLRKDLHSDILERMRFVKQLTTADERLVPAGQTTQFVVGAAGETDRHILHTTEALYEEIGLKRVHYSAFRPVSDTPLEGVRPTPPLRQHRLYQADWLLRIYGFPPQEVELALGEKGNLSVSRDPKLVIALNQPWLFPVDVNIASYDELLRVPGIGPLSARRIVEARRDFRIYSLEQLRKMRVPTKAAVPFIWFQGMLPSEKQTSFLPQLEDEMVQPAPSLASALG